MNYNHFNMNERIVIAQLKKSGCSIREISRILDRAPSSISREIKRNTHLSGKHYKIQHYHPVAAQKKYEDRKKKCGRKNINSSEIIEYIKEKIELHWSPEQISNYPSSIKVPSTATIYRIIHSNKIKNVSMANLRRKGKFQRPAETRGKFNDGGRTIKKRPKSVYKRQEIGHWEGDTVESGRVDRKRKSKYCFVTLAERKSRKYIAILVPDRTEKNVTPAIINALKDYPSEMVKTITFDRGKEFSGYEEIEKALNCNVYFCDPYCAWQKGTNENSNGLLREFYPKGMDLSLVNIKELNFNLELINNRPRKCLEYFTPNEIINKTYINCCT